MCNSILVSVIVPVYNVEKYVCECIESICSQSYSDIEIIIVDDGSTDRTLFLCKKFEKNDSRIKLFSKSNEGLGMTRNYGLKKAKGDYILFVDSDDILEKNAINTLVSIIRDYEADSVIGAYQCFDNEENVGEIYYELEDEKKYVYQDEEVVRDLLPKMLGSSVNEHDSIKPMVWGNLYNKKIIDKHGVEFCNEKELMSEDVFFDLNYFKHSKKTVYTNCVTLFYRQTPDSITHKRYREGLLNQMKRMYNYEIATAIELGIGGESILRIKRQFFVFLKICIFQEVSRQKDVKAERKEIRKILEDAFVKELIDNYPIVKIGIKQKIFLVMCKYRMCVMLWLIGKTFGSKI